MEDIFHQHIKVFRNPQHKLGRWGAVSTFYPADSFGAVSDSSGKVILVNATLFSDFSDIIMWFPNGACSERNGLGLGSDALWQGDLDRGLQIGRAHV